LLRTPQLRQPPAVQTAYAAIVTTQVRLITTLNAEIEQLGQVVAEHFGRHRDAERYLSLPGLGVVLAARILGEFGDDPTGSSTPRPVRTTPVRPRSPGRRAPGGSC
jgi:transposase